MSTLVKLVVPLVLAAVAAPSVAGAQTVECESLPGRVYGLGGSAQRPFIARVASLLAASTPPMTVIHQAPGACNGINALINNTRISGTASYWLADGTERQCTLPVTGQAVDFANMGNTAPNCPGVVSLPPTIGDFGTSVTSWNVIVPLASSQQSISAEALYFVYGWGAQSQVAPWIDESALIRRDANSAAALFISLATGLPVDRQRGIDARTNGNTVTLVAGATNVNAAIGYVSGEVADANRARVRTLAYQHFGQRCGYWPDSSATALDKRGVRDGNYWLWSVNHYYARIDAAGVIENPRARAFIGYLTGTTPAPAPLDVLRAEITTGNIPRCAMHVWRDGDLGALYSLQPDEPCGCFFEFTATGRAPDSCVSCAGGARCPDAAPVCRRGFCEVL
jgi:ABC-type phosphate transport system substrate-binding protein